MTWSEILPLIDLVYLNYTLYGPNDMLEDQLSEMFFRYNITYVDFANMLIWTSKRS